MRQWIMLSVLLLLLISSLVAAEEKTVNKPINIGVLAYSGKMHTLQRWQATASYLSKHIPNHQFTIVPLNLSEFEHAINKQSIDFFLTNSGQYVNLEVKSGASRLATMQTYFQQHVLSHFSSVIFTRSDAGIADLEALRGKRLAAVSQQAFGGYLLAQQAFQKAGIDASQDMQLVWLGFPHADIVKAVLSGKVDAGVVRTGVLETMVQQKQLSWDQLRLLAEKTHVDFPFRHSAELLPEWPFARLPHTDSQLAKRVTLALLQMPEDVPAAQNADIAGWTIPLNYSKVYQVLSDVALGSSSPATPSLNKVGQAHQAWMLGGLSLLLLSLLLVWRIFGINRQLQNTQTRLNQHKAQFEQAIEQCNKDLLQKKQEQQKGIDAQQLMEQNIHDTCDALQHLYVIATRYDLDREQRLQSMLEASREFLGMDIALMLYCDEQQNVNLLLSSPENYQATVPLNPQQLEQSILDKKMYSYVDEEQWQRYLVKPVVTAQQQMCIFEFAQHHALPEMETGKAALQFSDMHLRILDWMALWMENEQQCALNEHKNTNFINSLQVRFETLSPREHEVLALLAQGDTNKMMAAKLHLSPKTIELHRANLLRKTNAKSSIHLVKLAWEAKLLDRTGL